MKVYVITSGMYSDYHIDAVALDKEKAELICATLNNTSSASDHCYIEEYDTEDITVESKEEVKARFEMGLEYKSMKEMWFVGKVLATKEVNDISVHKSSNGSKEIKITATFSKDMSEEKARRIMLDRAAKFKAEREGI